MFDVFYSGVKPNLFPHEREALNIEHAQQLSRTRYFWWVNYLTDYSGWDFLWEPVPWQAEFTHVWPSQWHNYSGTYLVPKCGEIKYHFHSTILPNRDLQDNYQILVTNAKFDYTWKPHPLDPPFIYVFGNQWWPANKMATIEYHVPGAVERKFMDRPQATLLPQDNTHWHILIDCEWDYSWRPDPGDPPYIYVFGNQWHRAEVMPTVEYHVPGAIERKFMRYPCAKLFPNSACWIVPDGLDPDSIDYTWQPDPGNPPYVYQFGTQWQKTGGPQYCVPSATEVKYVLSPRANKISIDPYWKTPEYADTESFDYTWHPDSTEQSYIYQFGTQHQRTGGPQYCVPDAIEIKYVDQIKIKTQQVATAIYEIDHMDNNAGQIPNTTKIVRYFDNYLDTLRRLAKSIPDEHEFVWICSSVCDYTDFDFSWHPEQWQATMLHVFASDGEKFGDTFFMHVPTFLYRSEKLQLLDWYDLNFVGVSVPRRTLPVIQHTFDTHVAAVKTQDFTGPLAIYTTQDLPDNLMVPPVPLWREKTKTVVPLSAGASQVIVPKVAVSYIKSQLYDYPNINKTQRHMLNEEPLDIVFIDNGEVMAEYNWLQLPQTSVSNGIHRSSGVNGRVAAYQAAARLSNTPWFFAVFAKLEVNPSFNWNWQPDRMQQPKHYIFHAHNPVNDLVYGHQAMIAYNKQLVLENTAPGLDFTLDQEHEVVPVLSGTSHYDASPWMAWRTAFRECIKLQHSLPDVENEYRLRQWLTVDHTSLKWSQKGAEDAVEYYKAVDGDFVELKKSYDWAWLASYALLKRNLPPD